MLTQEMQNRGYSTTKKSWPAKPIAKRLLSEVNFDVFQSIEEHYGPLKMTFNKKRVEMYKVPKFTSHLEHEQKAFWNVLHVLENLATKEVEQLVKKYSS